MKRQGWLLFFAIMLAVTSVLPSGAADLPSPSFVIFVHGLWGSIDRLPPETGQAWLQASPYPHYRKHQEVEFLSGPDYQPIPQSYLKLAEGPSATRLIVHPYRVMQREFAYWAERLNEESGRERVRIHEDWQVLEAGGTAGDLNLIYLMYDWRLDLSQMVQDYVAPLFATIDRRWPGAEIHWIGHSLGGLVGRYVASRFPGRLTSLVSVAGPQYGLYEVGLQRRGERADFGGNRDKEIAQELSLWITERFFFGTSIIRRGPDFPAAAAEFTRRYTPVARWLDPYETNLLTDGFGSLPRLDEAVPEALAIYGLGFGSYDLQGNYHPGFPATEGVGPGRGPEGNPAEYALTGDGRVDPASARGPFARVLCVGKEMSHGDLMASPLILTLLVDRYFFAGAMNPVEILHALKRTGVPEEEREWRCGWLIRAREAWGIYGRGSPSAVSGAPPPSSLRVNTAA